VGHHFGVAQDRRAPSESIAGRCYQRAAEYDPVRDFEIIMHELASFSPMLAEKPMIVVATKLDATTDTAHLDELRRFAIERGLAFHAISSATGEGIKDLVSAMADALDRIPKPVVPASENDGAIEYREMSRSGERADDGTAHATATKRSSAPPGDDV